jgi:hypothetical protein
MSRASLRGRPTPGWVGLLGLAIVLAIPLAACGGGGGGGGGVHTVHVLLVNHTDKEANMTYSGGEPLGSSPDKLPIAGCHAGVIDYVLTDPFTIEVNGQKALDSAEVTGGIPRSGETDVVVWIDLKKDGSLSNRGINVGSRVVAPAQFGICG